MDSTRSNPFDFRAEVEKRLRISTSFVEQLSARTTVGLEQFGSRVQEAGLVALENGQSLDLHALPNALVIGVATYSNADMDFLNQFCAFLRSRQETLILDIDHITSEKELGLLLPSAPTFGKTPVVAEYKGGKLIAFAEGSLAINRLNQLANDSAMSFSRSENLRLGRVRERDVEPVLR